MKVDMLIRTLPALALLPSLAFAQILPSPRVAMPTDASQAVPKSYVDGALTGKASVIMGSSDPTGMVDASGALQACLTAATARGGVCTVTPGRFLINPAAVAISVPPNVTIKCQNENPGMTKNTATLFNTESALLLPPTKSITLQGAGGIDGCLIMRSGMTVPAADSSSFSGTAVNVTGGDAAIRHTTILGFNQCVMADAVDRFVVDGLYADCNNGLSLSNSFDSARLRGLHFWPYASVGGNNGSPIPSALTRPGIGLSLTSRNDDTYVEDALVFGYQTGIQVGTPTTNTGNIGFGSIWIDDSSAPRTTPPTCMTVQGGYDNLFITRLWAWTCSGLKVNSAHPTDRLHIGQYFASANIGDGLDISNGTTFIEHADISSTAGNWAINYGATVATLDIGQLNLHDLSTIYQPTPIGLIGGATNDMIRLPRVSYDGSKGPGLYGSAQLLYPSIASAATIAVPPSTTIDFTITGTNSIGAIQGPWNGRQIKLHFADAASVNGGNNILLVTAPFVAQRGSILALIYDSVVGQWVEEYRH